jgi:hypothetical protein
MAIAESVRVLKPSGQLIYTDLVMPRWFAAMGRRVEGNLAGFVTRDALRCVVEAQGLDIIRQHSSGPLLDLIGERPAGRAGVNSTGCAESVDVDGRRHHEVLGTSQGFGSGGGGNRTRAHVQERRAMARDFRF